MDECPSSNKWYNIHKLEIAQLTFAVIITWENFIYVRLHIMSYLSHLGGIEPSLYKKSAITSDLRLTNASA